MQIQLSSQRNQTHSSNANKQHPATTRQRALALAVSSALLGATATCLPVVTNAQVFPAVLELSSLDGSNGFVLDGEAADDEFGFSVSDAGDINGDGIDDLIVGARDANANGNSQAGRSYVVFGDDSGLPNPFNLSTLNGSNGFVLNGEAVNDRSGRSVSAAGDINGDGIDDLIVGAPYADPEGNNSAGRSYVVFGSDSGLSNPFNLSSLNGMNGFVLNGEATFDSSGFSVSAGGDINGDGIDDLIIGANQADPNGNSAAGRSYVVFGSASDLPNPFNLSSLDGTNGFKLDGEAVNDRSGFSVSAAGDINGDGIDDLIVGAYRADVKFVDSGRSYVVFGSDTGLPSPLNLSSLNGSNGFVLNGEAVNDRSGRSVSAAGDINGDGIDDLIIGAYRAGRSYVVFGSDISLPDPFDLSSLNGDNGFVLNNELGERFGISVSAAGDINGDGIDDLIIGADGAEPNGNFSGRSYVMFGSDSGLPNPFNLSSLNGSNGFVLNGEAQGDQSGASVSAAGDINGDGIDDLIIGADRADPNGNSDAGRSYVVFGRAAIDLAIGKRNGSGFVSANQPTTYFIDVANLGAVEVSGATLTDTLPATLDASTTSWICDGSGGAVCPNASGSGNISETIDLPVGGMLSYELTATVLATEGMTVTNTATVALPSGLTDINPADNSASDSDPVGQFADGFEDS